MVNPTAIAAAASAASEIVTNATLRYDTEVNTVILSIVALISALTPIFLAIINRNQNANFKAVKKSAEEAAQKAAIVSDKLVEHGEIINNKLDAVNSSVNGERAAMIAKLEAMHDEITRLHRLVYEKQIVDPKSKVIA